PRELLELRKDQDVLINARGPALPVHPLQRPPVEERRRGRLVQQDDPSAGLEDTDHLGDGRPIVILHAKVVEGREREDAIQLVVGKGKAATVKGPLLVEPRTKDSLVFLTELDRIRTEIARDDVAMRIRALDQAACPTVSRADFEDALRSRQFQTRQQPAED